MPCGPWCVYYKDRCSGNERICKSCSLYISPEGKPQFELDKVDVFKLAEGLKAKQECQDMLELNWVNEHALPPVLLTLLEISGVPNKLMADIMRARDEIEKRGTVRYPTKARIEGMIGNPALTILLMQKLYPNILPHSIKSIRDKNLE